MGTLEHLEVEVEVEVEQGSVLQVSYPETSLLVFLVAS